MAPPGEMRMGDPNDDALSALALAAIASMVQRIAKPSIPPGYNRR